MTEIPASVEDWIDEPTAAQLDDVAHLLQRRAEDKRRREEQTDEPEATERQNRINRSTFTEIRFPKGFPRRRR